MYLQYVRGLKIWLSIVFIGLAGVQILALDTSYAQINAANLTRGSFIINYTTTGGFAPTFKSIIYNSSDNRIIEIGGLPKHMEVEKKLTPIEGEQLENIILRNNFFQTRLHDYSPCCDLKYYYLAVTFNTTKNSVEWISGSSVPSNILEIVGSLENLVSFQK